MRTWMTDVLASSHHHHTVSVHAVTKDQIKSRQTIKKQQFYHF